jgi:Glycoside hydrolase 123, catalytic domain/Glycoside hydrolase 123 N-terminal domain
MSLKPCSAAFCIIAVAAALAAAPRSHAVESAGQPGQLVILNNRTVLRTLLVFQTPKVIGADGKFKPAMIPGRKPKLIPEFRSPLPDAEWRSLTFDDASWRQRSAPVEVYRGRASGRSLRALHTATKNSLICARASFFVEDPAKIKSLKLNLEYVGGAVVFVNGQEIARGNLPTGEVKPDTLAEKYPDDLYVEPGNKYLQHAKQNPKGFAKRYRQLKDVAIPAKLLKKGTNILAIEVHRAPVNEAATKVKRKPEGGMYRVPGLWAYAALRNLGLTAAPGSAVRSNVARPKGVQVWNCLPFDTITVASYGDPARMPAPVSITAVRNGVFSGRLMVSSDSPISGLKVSLSELKAQDGKSALPSAAVLLRSARPAIKSESWVPPHRFDGLVKDIPAEVPTRKVRVRRKTINGGATVPLWITVRVPKNAKPGQYQGTVTIQATGLKQTIVPVKLNVLAWTLPDPKDFRMKHTGVLSPDSLALRYRIPYWSEQHFKMMRKSMKLMQEVGSRQINIHLSTNFLAGGNSYQSIVRWIKQPDGSYKHDYKILDRYLDLVAEVLGKPEPIRLNCWGEEGKKSGDKVSLLDPKTGTLTPLTPPKLGSDECFKFWKPVVDSVLERMKKRGWLDTTAFGHNSYCYAPKPHVVDMAKKLWPKGCWSFTSHAGRLGSRFKGSKGTVMVAKYAECVWTEGRLSPRGYRALLKPGREKLIWNSVARNRHQDRSPLQTFLRLPEEMILRGHDGVGYISAELFPIENPKKKGRFYRLGIDRGGVAGMSTKALLAPGKDGPIATERFETFREGVQLCEAILFLQRALQARTISGKLAARVNTCLDARSETFLQGWESGRLRRDGKLFALAAAVAAAGGGKGSSK